MLEEMRRLILLALATTCSTSDDRSAEAPPITSEPPTETVSPPDDPESRPPDVGQGATVGTVEATCRYLGTRYLEGLGTSLDNSEARATVPGLSADTLVSAIALWPTEPADPCSGYAGCSYEGTVGGLTHHVSLPSVDGGDLVISCGGGVGQRVVFRYSLAP